MKNKKFIHIDEIHIPIILLDILKNGWLAILAAIAVVLVTVNSILTKSKKRRGESDE